MSHRLDPRGNSQQTWSLPGVNPIRDLQFLLQTHGSHQTSLIPGLHPIWKKQPMNWKLRRLHSLFSNYEESEETIIIWLWLYYNKYDREEVRGWNRWGDRKACVPSIYLAIPNTASQRSVSLCCVRQTRYRSQTTGLKERRALHCRSSGLW